MIVAKSDGVEDPETSFFAFHIRGRRAAKLRVNRIALVLGVSADQAPTDKHDRHRGPNRPAVAEVLDFVAEQVNQRAWNQKDREHLDEIRERRRVFKRMGRIGVEKSAAVGPEHLDRDLRSDRPLAIVCLTPSRVVTSR